MKKTVLVILLFILSSCSGNKYSQKISPEDLINTSAEKVSFSVTDENSVVNIEQWIQDDFPTTATISCPEGDSQCQDVISKLERFNIPFNKVSAAEGDYLLTLIYRRVAARDCNRTDFGCSTSVNSLQMVKSYQQYVSPQISGPKDAQKAYINYNNYLNQ